jgi:hypothetical protein
MRKIFKDNGEFKSLKINHEEGSQAIGDHMNTLFKNWNDEKQEDKLQRFIEYYKL